MISIDFYDDLGKIRDSRVVKNDLRCDQPIDSAHGITYVYSRDTSTAHTPYRGGRMEIYSMDVDDGESHDVVFLDEVFRSIAFPRGRS